MLWASTSWCSDPGKEHLFSPSEAGLGWLAGWQDNALTSLSASTAATPGQRDFRGPSGAFPGTLPPHTPPHSWSNGPDRLCAWVDYRALLKSSRHPCAFPPVPCPQPLSKGCATLRFITRSISLASLRFQHRAAKTLGTS